MNRWKKVAAAAAALVITTGAGAAWAQDGGDNAGPAVSGTPTRALGDTNRESIFQAITPCRLVDTRIAGGKFSVSQERVYDVRGSGATFAAQGGAAGGCGIPSGATAVEITVTAADAVGKGFVRVYPSSAPNATFLNFTNAFNASNSGTVALCGANGGLCLVNADLRVKDFGPATHIIIDVQGYYQQQMGAQVNADSTLGRNSRAVSSDSLTGGNYVVRFDRDVSDCAYNATVGAAISGTVDGFANAQPASVSAQGVFVETFDANGVKTALPFYLTVTC